jgi:hypothetical protein
VTERVPTANGVPRARVRVARRLGLAGHPDTSATGARLGPVADLVERAEEEAVDQVPEEHRGRELPAVGPVEREEPCFGTYA